MGLFGSADPNAICDLVAAFGNTCVACSDGSGTFCLLTEVEQMTADPEPGLVLAEIDAADVAADPTCQ